MFQEEFASIRNGISKFSLRIEKTEEKQASFDKRLEKTKKEIMEKIELNFQQLKAGLEGSRKDFSQRIEVLKKLINEQREASDKRLLLLAERLSALEQAVKKRKLEIETLGMGLETLSRNQRKIMALIQEIQNTLQPEQPVPTNPQEKEKYLDMLGKLLKEGNVDQRFDAIGKLEKIGGPKAVSLVATRLDDSDLWIRRFAAVVLGRMGGMIAIEALIKALEDKSQVVREAAFESLKKLTGKSHGYGPGLPPKERKKAVERWKTWWLMEKARLKSKKS